MLQRIIRNRTLPIVVFLLSLASSQVSAAGIVLGGTRVIYSSEMNQSSISVRNTSTKHRYMVQSWAEDSYGKKTSDFVITPPVYVSNPGNDNTLRIMYAGKPVVSDRETLYYLNSKAIPAMDKKEVEGKNLLMLSTVTKIKMFVRPKGLKVAPDKVPEMLSFNRSGQNIIVENASPYFATLINIKAGNRGLESIMVAPFSSSVLNNVDSNVIEFQTINDYGGYTEKLRKTL